jgi:hypothetical protein
LTALNTLFLFRMHAIQATQLKDLHEQVGQVHEKGGVVLDLLTYLFDGVTENGKFILVALVLSLLSAAVFIWALVRPARWKAYCLLVVGIGFAWISGRPPEKLASALAQDRNVSCRRCALFPPHALFRFQNEQCEFV